MNFIAKAYKDYHILAFLFFVWVILYSFYHLVDGGLSVLRSHEVTDRKMMTDLFLHILTIINGLLILKEKSIGVWLWLISPFVIYGVAFFLFDYDVVLSVEFLTKKALYLLFPALLLFLKQNGQSGWKVLFYKNKL